MAISDNFVFADPQLQAQIVNAAQVRAAADAARAQQFGETLRALRQERQLQADREERRAERDRVIREGEARSAENKRQFDESLRFNREVAAANKEIAAGREKKVETKEDYNNLLRLLDVRNDASTLPTVKELESRMAGLDLTDKQKQSLREERQRSYDTHKRNAKLIQDEVNGLNSLLDAGAKDKLGVTLTPDRILKGSQFKNSIAIDWSAGRLKPLISLPRDDETGEDDFRFYQHPGVRTGAIRGFIESRMPGGGPESIGSVQQRLQATARPGFWASLLNSVTDPFADIQRNLPMAAGAARLFRVPTNAPPASVVGAGPGVYVQPMEPRFRVPMPIPERGNEGVLPPLDYTGPEYDYPNAPRFAVPEYAPPEDILAPPVFVPQY